MLFDLLTVAHPSLASELLERTASTLRVQEIVRLSLAPVFLLAAIGTVMNVMMSRLIWVADRIERLEARMKEFATEQCRVELDWLRHRRRLAQRAVMFATVAALTISLVIAMLFISAFIKPQIGTAIAVAWIATMLLMLVALGLFVQETVVAARGHKKAEESDAAEAHGPGGQT